ncbi:hypothetical protein [Nocardia brasiliensis]|uniref:hypothetical protein n=1 Tax=Nocardia brasiliensis TaxID=37326 RepID=UPI0024562CAD|nr:hypothetical protein [Nocardia brasiliensis]
MSLTTYPDRPAFQHLTAHVVQHVLSEPRGIELTIYRPTAYRTLSPGTTSTRHGTLIVTGMFDMTSATTQFSIPNGWTEATVSDTTAMVAVVVYASPTGDRFAQLEPIDFGPHGAWKAPALRFGGNLAGSTHPAYTDALTRMLGYPVPAGALPVYDNTST